MAGLRIVADLGNSRLKWAEVGPDGAIGPMLALPIGDSQGREISTGASEAREPGDLFAALGEPRGQAWAVASVNPPAAGRLGAWLGARGVGSIGWYRSAADVSLRHLLLRPEATGADRALAVSAALAMNGSRGPGLVVSCGTAVTVERVSDEGVWEGGAIAPGLSPMSLALHATAAQLPLAGRGGDGHVDAPPPLGRETASAMAAGLYWGLVGSVREILARQAEGLPASPWVVWTGGDAGWLARGVEGPGARVVPDLVLRGLAREAFGGDGPAALRG